MYKRCPGSLYHFLITSCEYLPIILNLTNIRISEKLEKLALTAHHLQPINIKASQSDLS